MINFINQWLLRSVLRKSFILLSRSNHTHYKEVKEEIEKTRTILLQLEGYNFSSLEQINEEKEKLKTIKSEIFAAEEKLKVLTSKINTSKINLCNDVLKTLESECEETVNRNNVKAM